MAVNGTSGALPALITPGLNSPMTIPITIGIAVVIAFLVLHTLTPSVDPREPPLVRPRIPFIGHIVGLMRHQAQFHMNLQRSTHKTIATLPMLTGKMYAVWDPQLVASGLRNKSLSVNPHILAATPKVAQVSAPTAALLRGPDAEHIVDRVLLHAVPASLRGAGIQRLNRTALDLLAAELTALAPSSTRPVRVPNTWLFIRRLLSTATTTAVYGPAHNPFSDPAVEAALWELEKNLLKLTLDLPAVFTRAGNRARQTLFDALTPYYKAHRDTDPAASEFIRNRAEELRAAGIPDEDLARVEVMLPFAALANTVPLLFWMVCFVFSRPELVRELRQEVEGLVVAGGKSDEEEGDKKTTKVMLTAGTVEERCPLLMACYKETQRVAVHQVSTRTVMRDVVLRDAEGREYLLKEGGVVQLVIGAGHGMEEYWGKDGGDFRPERFLAGKGEDGEASGGVRATRVAFQPFGGGLHLCPGRQFAFAEMMAVMVTLLLAFELEPLEGTEWVLPEFATRSMIDAVTKPARHGEGFGLTIRRRSGWEGVRWEFEL